MKITECNAFCATLKHGENIFRVSHTKKMNVLAEILKLAPTAEKCVGKEFDIDICIIDGKPQLADSFALFQSRAAYEDIVRRGKIQQAQLDKFQ